MATTYVPGTFSGSNISATAFAAELDKIRAALDQTLSRIADTANQMEQNLDMNDHSILNVLTDASDPTSLTTVEYVQGVLGTGTDVSALVADVANLQSSLATLQGSVSSLTGVVSTNQNTAATNEADIAQLQTDLATINALITSIQGSLTTLQGSVTSLTTTVGTVQNLAATNEAAIAAQALLINDNTLDIDDLDTDLTAALADIANLQSSLAALQGNVTALTATVALVQIDATAAISRINNLKQNELRFSFQDSLPDATVVATYTSTKDYILRNTGGSTATGVSRGSTSTPATSGNADFDIQLNGVSVGAILFGNNAAVATFTVAADAAIAPGDVLTIVTGTQLELESPSITLVIEEIV